MDFTNYKNENGKWRIQITDDRIDTIYRTLADTQATLNQLIVELEAQEKIYRAKMTELRAKAMKRLDDENLWEEYDEISDKWSCIDDTLTWANELYEKLN